MFEPVQNQAVIYNGEEKVWYHFAHVVEIISVSQLNEVLPALRRIDERVEKDGLYAAGFITYEAAPAFDAALHVRPRGNETIPLLWFAIYSDPERISSLPEIDECGEPNWDFSVDHAHYTKALDAIKKHIDRGDTYQVNYTERLYSVYKDSLWPFFCRRARRAHAAYAAYIQTDDITLCSFSPELFFRRDGRNVVLRPMKGTAARGTAREEDKQQAEWLYHSEKNRAENVMIVDMIRNDIGRVAVPGTVDVPKLFSIEQYPTVWQMTSTVCAQVDAGNTDLMKALFPCASITGAPKCRTMQIIAEQEKTSRGIYTGTIGWMGPGRRAEFNVAIRTVCRENKTGRMIYGVGGGIVWDSDIDEEFEECRMKSRVLNQVLPEFDLLESLLWEPGTGYFLKEYHLDRLMEAARYFDYPIGRRTVEQKLETFALRLMARSKVRLLVDRDGGMQVEANGLKDADPFAQWSVRLADEPIDTTSPFVYYKTTKRDMYDAFKKRYAEVDEVILWNEEGELTETCFSNIAVGLDGKLFTPPVSCGLLGGTYRRHLVENGVLEERVIKKEELINGIAVFLLNSVRGMRKAVVLRQVICG